MTNSVAGENQATANTATDISSVNVATLREMITALKPYKKPLLVAVVIGMFATAAAALQPLVVSAIVDGFSKGFPVTLAIGLGLLLVVNGVLTAVRQLILQKAGEKFAFETRERLVRRLYNLQMEQYDRRGRGDLVSRVSGDVTQTRDIITSGMVDLISQAITIIVALVMMAFIDPILLSISFGIVAVILILLILIARQTGPAGLRHQEAIGELASSVTRALGSIKTIRATQSTLVEGSKSIDYAKRAMVAGFSIARLKALVESFSGISIQVLLIVIIGAGGLRVAAGALSTGQLSAFIMYLLLMAAPLALVGGISSMLGEALGALGRILELERIPIEVDKQLQKSITSDQVEDPTNIFEFDNVYFSYGQTNDVLQSAPAALSGVSLSLVKGTTTAIVGPSGAGKSTIIALLERFYDASEGKLYFYGRDVQTVSRTWVRSHVSYVDQESVVLSGTVRENLRLGNRKASDQECSKVLVDVGLCTDGVDATKLLGREVGESGARLSGGQRQRLAIARAYLADSPVFLLDEFSSNLDSLSEVMVQNLILQPAAQRTVVVVAHRFSTVVNADKIILMDQGKILSIGTHSELMEKSLLYRELATHQLKPLEKTEASSQEAVMR